MTVAAATLANGPVTFASVSTNLGVAAWVFPTDPTQTNYRFPSSNTRQILIYNTGANALLVGMIRYASEAALPSSAVLGLALPYAFQNATYPNAAGGAIIPAEGDNCFRVPAGGSFSLDFGAFDQRGNATPQPSTTGLTGVYPFYCLFFSSIVGNTTADILYTNRFGAF